MSNLLSVEQNGTFRRLNQLADALAERGLATAGLAYDTEYFTAAYFKINIINGLDKDFLSAAFYRVILL